MKKIIKLTLITFLIVTITGCGGIPEEAREDEKNYKEMIENDFKTYYDQEFIILNDESIKSTFIAFGKEEDTTEHIIDAALKDDPTFKFRICTGFEEVPTFKIEYNYKTKLSKFIKA